MEIKRALFTGERDEARVKEKAKYGLIISSVWLKLKWSFTHSHHVGLTKAAEALLISSLFIAGMNLFVLFRLHCKAGKD